MTEVPFRPAEILRVLAEHDVDYVLIGGLATIAHGSPHLTQDVDITPEPSGENWSRLSKALTALNAKVRVNNEEPLPFGHDATSLAAARVWNLVTDFGEFDISVVPSGTEGYPDFVRGASVREVFGIRVKVADLADIIRSKQAANRPKDQRVLPVLREILATRHEREPR
jgi:hypothetical protein